MARDPSPTCRLFYLWSLDAEATPRRSDDIEFLESTDCPLVLGLNTSFGSYKWTRSRILLNDTDLSDLLSRLIVLFRLDALLHEDLRMVRWPLLENWLVCDVRVAFCADFFFCRFIRRDWSGYCDSIRILVEFFLNDGFGVVSAELINCDWFFTSKLSESLVLENLPDGSTLVTRLKPSYYYLGAGDCCCWRDWFSSFYCLYLRQASYILVAATFASRNMWSIRSNELPTWISISLV